MLNKIGGNIEMLGGLGAQSRTATQDKLLNANSSASVQAMQQNVIEGTAKVMKSLCWYWHHHPQYEMTAYHPIQGLPNPIVRKVSPQQRKRVPFEALELKVDPYSLQYQTPEQKVALLNQIVTTIVVPMMGMLQQQGISFDMNKYLEIIATGANSPELTEIIQSIQVPDGPQGTGSDEGPTKAPTSSRTYNRVNASTASDQGQSKAMQQALLGQNAGGNPSTTKVGR